MSMFQTNMSGPLALNVQDGTLNGAGAELTLHESTWARGEVCQFFNAANASIDGVNLNKLDSADGTLANAGLVDDADDGFLAVVTSKDSVPAGYEGSAVVHGEVYAMINFSTAGAAADLNEGQKLYAVAGQKYLTPIVGDTGTGRACAVSLATIAAADLSEGTRIVRVIFSGTPPFLG